MNRLAKVFTAASAASLYCACASTSPAPSEHVAASAAALTGTISFDASCTAPLPDHPEVVPAWATRNLQIAEAYSRIVAASPAFAECMSHYMGSAPYLACAGDPEANPSDIVGKTLTANGTLIHCDYSAIGTSRGGSAGIGAIDGSGNESLNFGAELASIATTPANCAYNPDGARCVDDSGYTSAAGTIGHEIMHTHGFNHVSDWVWNLNDVNVGDVINYHDDHGVPQSYPLTLGDFCGIAPAYTPGNGGVAPGLPTDTPTPGPHPTYATSIPYMVGGCIDLVLRATMATGHMHDDCGPTYAGMKLVDSVIDGSPGTTTTNCVLDPYTGAPYASGGAPIPPHAPSECVVRPSCKALQPAITSCAPNANPVTFESHNSLPGRWLDATGRPFDASLRYRACADSLYGRACAPATRRTANPCLAEKLHFVPIPWWKWDPFQPQAKDKSKFAARAEGRVMAFAVPANDAKSGSYAFFGGASGDLSTAYGALGLAIYNPQLGLFNHLGASTGVLPSMRGTAMAAAVSADGTPHLIAIGGEDDKGVPFATIYDGKLAIGSDSFSASWTSAPIATKTGPGARTHASAAGSFAGDTVYLFGGSTPSGLASDLWSYDVNGATWKQLAAPGVAARTDAAMAADENTLVVFGGANGKTFYQDVLVLDLASGKMQSLVTAVTPRSNAALAIANGYLYIYGGVSSAGPSNALDVVDLSTGKTISSSAVANAASLAGASLAVDETGEVTIVPGKVAGASLPGGAFVGVPDNLTFVEEQLDQ